MNNYNSQSWLQSLLYPPQKISWRIENIALMVWIFAVVASTLTHEMWRDETRQFMMATQIESLTDYFDWAKYDGHPLLWRVILTTMYWFVQDPVALQMASLLVGFVTVYLLVRYASFPLFIKIIFIFGLIPFGNNAVEARNYGISMLIFFAIAAFYKKSKEHPILFALLIFLEANTNQFGMYMAGLLLAGWVGDSGFHVLKDKKFLFAIALGLAGVAISYYSTRPIDPESAFVSPEFLANIQWNQAIINAFQHPGKYIYYILHLPLVYRDIFVLGLVIGLFVVRPYLGLTLYGAITFFNIVAFAFLYPQTRHQGVLYGFIVALYWIGLSGLRSGRPGLFKYSKEIFNVILFAFLVPWIVHAAVINKSMVEQEARVVKSSAQALGNYLKANKQLKQAVIIGSPDYVLPPISFYSGNNLYLTKEKTYRNFVTFSLKYDTPEYLSDLLKSAEELYEQNKKPVVIVLGYFGIVEGKIFKAIDRGDFIADNVEQFIQKTIKIAEFNSSLGDEDYQVFLYMPQEKLEQYRKRFMELR